jgi:hypothetical protein
MVTLLARNQFILDSVEDIGILRRVPANYFQSYEAAQLAIPHLVNRAHATLSEHCEPGNWGLFQVRKVS